jgi:hypothetical protein
MSFSLTMGLHEKAKRYIGMKRQTQSKEAEMDAWTRIYHAWKYLYSQYENAEYRSQEYNDLGAAIDILWEAQKQVS